MNQGSKAVSQKRKVTPDDRGGLEHLTAAAGISQSSLRDLLAGSDFQTLSRSRTTPARRSRSRATGPSGVRCPLAVKSNKKRVVSKSVSDGRSVRFLAPRSVQQRVGVIKEPRVKPGRTLLYHSLPA